MKLFVICLFLASFAFATHAKPKSKTKSKAKPVAEETYTCDVNQDLPKKSVTLRLHDSQKFRSVYTGLYSDLQISVNRICEYLKKCEFASAELNDSEVRAGFLQTGSGQSILSQLENLRSNFDYSAVDYYLTDDHELNRLGNTEISNRYKKGDRTYYLADKRVIGYLDQVGEEGVLTRLGKDCKADEIVSFSNIQMRENNVRMIVNKKYCTTVQNKGPDYKLTTQDVDQLGAFLLNLGTVEDQLESQQLCEYWLPKPEPMGTVITADDPPKSKTKSKSSKTSKKKKPVKAKSAQNRTTSSSNTK